MVSNNDKLLQMILGELKEVKAVLKCQDEEIDKLKDTIRNSGKYTIKQIIVGLALILPILGFFKDIIRIKLMG